MSSGSTASDTRTPLDLFADHWEDPSGIESRIRARPHKTLAEYGIHAPKDRVIKLAVNEPGLFNLRVLLDLEHDAPFWEIGSLTKRMAAALFSFTHCPVRTWCDGGLEFATPRYLEVMERCRSDEGYLEAFRTSPKPELTAAGIPIPENFRINVRICDHTQIYIVLIAPRGREEAAQLRTRNQTLLREAIADEPTLRDLWIEQHRTPTAAAASRPAGSDAAS